MKRFSHLTDNEILALSNEEFEDSVRIEAIERGIAPPVKLSEALRTSEWRGYRQPGDGAVFWEIQVPGLYRSERSGVAYRTEAEALKAMEGAVALRFDEYGDRRGYNLNPQEGWTVARAFVPSTAHKQTWSKFEAAVENNPDFDKVAEECAKKQGEVWQADYNRRVNLERKAEYLRLAGGDETIARAFWGKAYPSTEWPA